MRNQGEILNALNARLLAFESGDWATYTKFEGGAFDPPSDHLWIKQDTVWQIPKLIGAFSDEGAYREQGLYQLTVVDKIGNGVMASANLASRLQSWFPRGSVLTYSGVSVKIELAYRTSSLEVAPWINTPVTIVFWSYAQYGS